jgi:phosphoglycolate phosphatase-like HAD superfamily hydrolase
VLRGTVVLWDIDGTLLHTRGFGVRAFTGAIERATGMTWVPERLDFGGRTDRDIASVILASMGLTDGALVGAVLDALVAAYDELADELAAAVRVLPGVVDSLTTLAGHGALQTLVTGNVLPAATAKVTAAGVKQHLRMELGGYGSDDHERRADLVRLSIDRVTAAGHRADPGRVWVIGDTPRDLECARASGVRCALVGTGTHRAADLLDLGADLVLDDLGDGQPLIEALRNG